MKVELMPGIASISGTIENKHGIRTLFKTFRKANGKTETRMYMQPVSERATLPSEKEIAHRKLFSEASQYVKTLSEEQRKAYAEAWKKDDYQFNGKRYSTLQGYIIARCYKNSKLVNVS